MSNRRLRSAQLAAGSGSGSMKMWRWSKAASRRVSFDSSMALPNTSPDMSPTPMAVNGWLWMSRPSSRKWRFTASQVPLRRDAHLLVVVAVAAAGREGVAQPEAALFGDGVGDVGEGGGALVGGDHQIGIVLVVAHDMLGRHHAAVGMQIVGDVEQGVDEDLIRGDGGRLNLFARGAHRQLLGIEAALGAHRHDDGVLHLLRLDQAEHLGAEILAPVAPADAAARDFAEAQMHAFDRGRIDEDLHMRARCGQFVQLFGVQLDGDVGFGAAVLVRLIEIRAQHAGDDVAQAADDAVVVQALHVGERGFDLLLQNLAAAAAVGRAARMEQRDQQPGDVGIAGQRLLHIVLAELDGGLAQELRGRAQNRDIAPIRDRRRSPAG